MIFANPGGRAGNDAANFDGTAPSVVAAGADRGGRAGTFPPATPDPLVSAGADSPVRPATPARLCAVIPCYDEGETIASLVRAVRRLGLETIVVDDGSRDATAAAAADAGAWVVRNRKNRGKGAALARGLRCALRRGFIRVIVMDGDGQHDPADIPRLAAEAERTGALVVIGDRSADRARMPAPRRWSNRIGSWCVSRVAGRDLPDSQSGFRCVDPRGLLALGVPPGRYETESAWLIRAARAGCGIAHVPIRARYPAPHSRFRPVRDAARIAAVLIVEGLRVLAGARP